MTVRVHRNDWSTVAVPPLGAWRPALTVSVVIPAYQCQSSLDLTLAALSRQTYPPELLEVVVVDDGSQPPLQLPKRRPDRCRIVRPPHGWGRANALHHGARESTGEVIHWLDADMLVYPAHIEAQARWHDRLPYAVTLGAKRFVAVQPGDRNWPTVDEVAGGGAIERLFAGVPSTGHDYVERQIARTDRLRAADHLGFLAHVGATAALRRELYEATGGLDTSLRLGEDTEFGYRLSQAGAVFIPEPRARSWHLGASHMMRHEAALQRYNRPFLADRMPLPRWLRRTGRTCWSVPLVTVVVTVDGQSMERVRAVVDALLGSDEPDLQVQLVAGWHTLADQPRPPLSDPGLELRLIAACYRGEPRVRLVERMPRSAYPSPYLLTVPAGYGLARPAVRRLLEHADRHQLGLVTVATATGATVRLWRTAAMHRAGWVRRPGEPLAAAVTELHSAGTLGPARAGMVALAGYPDAELTGGLTGDGLTGDGLTGGSLTGDGSTGDVVADAATGRWLPGTVPVAGARSLARAAWVVARLAAVRARLRLHRSRSRIRRLLRR
jgi:GT2 family glycosyltransferase